MTVVADPILQHVPDAVLASGKHLIRWIESRGLPRPNLAAVDAERARRWSTPTPPTTTEEAP